MDNEIMIKMGMLNFGQEYLDKEDFARSSFGYILADLNDLKEKYICLGFHLHEFNVNEYYKAFGFATFKDFCNENMPVSYSTCSRCIQVFLEFSDDGKMFVAEQYKDFTFTQLCEMLPLDSRRREIIKPDWSREKIRRYKNGLKKHDEKTFETQDEPDQQEVFGQVLQNPNVMSFLIRAFEVQYGENCIDNYETTAKTATLTVAGERYRLQLNKIK